MDNFAYRIEIRSEPFLLAGCIALALALAAVSYHAIRASRLNPAAALQVD